MRVNLHGRAACERGGFGPGECDVPDDLGRAWVSAGAAESLEEPAQQEPEPAAPAPPAKKTKSTKG